MGTDNGRAVLGHTLAWTEQALEADWKTNEVSLAEGWGCRPGQGGAGGGDVLIWQCADGLSAQLPNALPELGGKTL